MEEIEKLILEKHPLIAKYYRERINKVQEVYSYGEELLPELKKSITLAEAIVAGKSDHFWTHPFNDSLTFFVILSFSPYFMTHL